MHKLWNFQDSRVQGRGNKGETLKQPGTSLASSQDDTSDIDKPKVLINPNQLVTELTRAHCLRQ